MRTIVITAACVALVSTVAWSFEIHHPNLREAYAQTENAIKHIQEAQAANRGIEFGGHAEKAIEALKHAQEELVAGDKFNDAHHK